MSDDVVLEARSVTKIYQAPTGGQVYALADVDVDVRRGRTLGLVGESGSGKTTLTRLLLNLEPPTEGEVVFEGRSLKALTSDDLRNYRHAVAAVFQNPYSSLDPRMRIWDAITQQQAIERSANKKARRLHAQELLDVVGLGAPMADRYPHQLSGGQRQRVAIARAISQDPEVIILDEPLSALDVSVSAQIVNLLLDLQDRIGVTYVFVGHDLRLVRHLCHDVAVMYRGTHRRARAGARRAGPSVASVHRRAGDGVGVEDTRRHRRRRLQGGATRHTARLRLSDALPTRRCPVRGGDTRIAAPHRTASAPLPPSTRCDGRVGADALGMTTSHPG